MRNMVVVIKNGFGECAEKYTWKELQELVSNTLNRLPIDLGVNENLFFEIIGYLSDYSTQHEKGTTRQRTYPKLSADTLRVYQRTGFSDKYVFEKHRAIMRTYKKAVALYIGKDIDDDNSFVEQYAGCINLPKSHLLQVENNWRKQQGTFETKLFKYYEAARMLIYPEAEKKAIEKQRNDVRVALDVLKVMKNQSLDNINAPFLLHSDEYAGLVNIVQQFPKIIGMVERFENDLNNQYREYDRAEPKIKLN